MRSLLCLNGALPSSTFFDQYQHLPFVASDGAGCRLAKMGFSPQLVVGDFDSFSGQALPECTYVRDTDQNSTDFDKCLQEMGSRQLFPTLVVGIAGGSLDHSLYALQRFTAHSATHEMLLYDEQPAYPSTWAVAVYGNRTFTLPAGCLVSFICFTRVTVTTIGLQWNLSHAQLEPGGLCAIRNRVVDKTVSLQVLGGGLLVLVCLPT
ncbi:MAG: thiamine diphosphokinase [Myxococcota bacterium]